MRYYITQAERLTEEQSHMAKSPELQKWRSRSLAIRHELQIPAQSTPWTSRPRVRLLGIPRTPRVMDCVDVCFAAMQQKYPELSIEQLIKGMFCNTSQSVARLPVSRSFPTPCTSSVVYSYEHDTLVSGRATMKLLGWPDSALPRDVSETLYKGLSGDGFSAPISSMLMTVFFANPWAPWHQ